MRNEFITEEDAMRAFDWLRDTADEAAEAKAHRIYVEEYRKTLKAQLMKEHDGQSAVIQERNAYADPRYISHLDAIKQAVFQDVKLAWLKDAAEARLSAWQTYSANTRR